MTLSSWSFQWIKNIQGDQCVFLKWSYQPVLFSKSKAYNTRMNRFFLVNHEHAVQQVQPNSWNELWAASCESVVFNESKTYSATSAAWFPEMNEPVHLMNSSKKELNHYNRNRLILIRMNQLYRIVFVFYFTKSQVWDHLCKCLNL